MYHVNDPSTGTDQLNPSRRAPVTPPPVTQNGSVLHVDDPFWMPVTGALRHRVHSLLRRGARTIILDLTGLSRIDAAGVGQLVRAYNVTVAEDGVLRLVHASARVREILERVGLFNLLDGSLESDDRPQ